MAIISEFYKRLRDLCEERNMTVNELVRILELSSGSPTAWKSGTIPRNTTVQKIADYFHVSADYLVGNVNDPFFYLDNERILREINSYKDEETPTTNSERDILDEVDIGFYGEYKELDEEQKETVRDMVRVMRLRRKNGSAGTPLSLGPMERSSNLNVAEPIIYPTAKKKEEDK